MRRRSRSLSPKKVHKVEDPGVSWRNVTGHFLTLEEDVGKVHARLEEYGALIAAHKARLEADGELLPLAEVSRIAKQFRADTRDYTASLEEVLDGLEQGNLAMATALDKEECHRGAPAEVASSEDEQAHQGRKQLSKLMVWQWLRFRQPQHGHHRPPSSVESSSSHSELGSGIIPKRPKRKVRCFPPLKTRVSLEDRPETQEGEDGDEESGAVTEDQDGPLGLTDESRGVPDGRTSSSWDGGVGASSGAGGGARSSSGNGDTGGTSSGDGGAMVFAMSSGGGSPSGDREAGGSASGDSATGGTGGYGGGDDGMDSDEPASQGTDDLEASPAKTSVTQYKSAMSASFQSFHSATSGGEADCEPELTTNPAASTTSMSNSNGKDNRNEISSGSMSGNGESNVNGNSNGISNGRATVHSTASQTEESWIAWDCVELGSFNKNSTWSVLHELCRQQGLLRLALRHHMERLQQLRQSRLHLLSHTHPLHASWLLRDQLQRALRTVASEVRATQHSLRMRAGALDLFASSVWRGRPLLPPPQDTSPQQLLQTAAALARETRRPALGDTVRRAMDFLLCISSRES